MKNPNNIITVNFPNGQSRTRNCMSTIVPDERVSVPQQFPAHGDFFSKVNYALLNSNKLKIKINEERARQKKDNEAFETILYALILILIGLMYVLIKD